MFARRRLSRISHSLGYRTTIEFRDRRQKWSAPAVRSRYELLARLPGGGMAEVYRARTVIDKAVLVKILKPLEDDPDIRTRFFQEARVAASLSHENIVSVYDYGECGDLPYMVMEFLEGETLDSAIGRGALSDERRVLDIALQVARAIEFVHSNGVIHRDIKPSNIFVTNSGLVKLIDFGISKSVEAMVKTQTGMAVGTAFYMAPEQDRGETAPSVDHIRFRADPLRNVHRQEGRQWRLY